MNENATNGMLIVERIDDLLKKKNENRVSLAEVLGIKPQNISAWSARGTVPAAAGPAGQDRPVSGHPGLHGVQRQNSAGDGSPTSRYHGAAAGCGRRGQRKGGALRKAVPGGDPEVLRFSLGEEVGDGSGNMAVIAPWKQTSQAPEKELKKFTNLQDSI